MSKSNRTTKFPVLLLIGIALPAIGSAAAPSQIDTVSVKVSYADLDIHSQAGARVLYSRLKRASEEVCGIKPHVVNSSLAATTRARSCLRDTLEASVEAIDSDALTDIHTG